MAINKADLIKKIAIGADISIAQAARTLNSFENAIQTDDYQEELRKDNSYSWRGGNQKKGGKFGYIRK
jgi:hypothetical protein